MKFIKISLIFTTLTIFVFACAENNKPESANNTAIVTNSNVIAATEATPDELASAKKIYTETCSRCHKDDGTGGVGEIDGVKIKAPNFASERMKKDSDADWIAVIENGEKSDGMPAYKGKISDAEIKNLVKYIRREFQGKQ